MRPRLHFTAPQNWINDPNGLVYYQGEYHIFYQHFPYTCEWGTMHWGHAVSTDLVSFKHLPIALYPSKYYDRNGCFSGSAIIYNKQLYIYYTSIRYAKENPDNVHIQYSDDDLIATQSLITSLDGYTFDNVANKQLVIDVIKDAKIGDVRHTRDPKVWIGKNNLVYMIIGSKIPSQKGYDGTLLFYESKDGREFTYKNSFSDSSIGDMWECPDVFAIDNQHYLIFSPENIDVAPKPISNAVYMPITFEEETCTICNIGEYQYLDYGLDFYAPQTFIDEYGNRIMIGWLRMRQPVNDESWVGMLSMPRVLVNNNGYLYQTVHPNIKKMFTKKIDVINLKQPFLMKVKMNQNTILNFGGFIISIENDCLSCHREAVSIIADKVCNHTLSPKLESQYELEIYYDYHVFEIYINQGRYVMSQIVYELESKIEMKDIDIFTVYTLGRT